MLRLHNTKCGVGRLACRYKLPREKVGGPLVEDALQSTHIEEFTTANSNLGEVGRDLVTTRYWPFFIFSTHFVGRTATNAASTWVLAAHNLDVKIHGHLNARQGGQTPSG